MHHCPTTGFYQYNILPMGLLVATDSFQDRMNALLGYFDYVIVFLDDILIIGNGSFDEHLEQVLSVIQRFLKTGKQVNPLKSFWFQEVVEYLGYVINREEIKN